MYWVSSKKSRSTLTEPVREDFLVDFNKGKLVEIEILDVSAKIPNNETRPKMYKRRSEVTTQGLYSV